MAHYFKERECGKWKQRQSRNNKRENWSVHDSSCLEKYNRLHLIENND